MGSPICQLGRRASIIRHVAFSDRPRGRYFKDRLDLTSVRCKKSRASLSWIIVNLSGTCVDASVWQLYKKRVTLLLL